MQDTALVRKISIIDESLAGTHLDDCTLLMEHAGRHFSWCLFDKSRNKFLALGDYLLASNNTASELQQILDSEELLGRSKYQKTVIGIHSFVSTLVPAVLYKKEDAQKMLELAGQVNGDHIPAADMIRYSDAVNIYAADRETVSVFNNQFPQLSIIHSGTALIEGELFRNKNETYELMTVNVRDEFYDIVVTRGSTLVFYNSFRYKTIEDFIYYILFVMEQLKMNPEKAPLRLAGEIEKTSSTFMIADKYIRNISFGTRLDACTFSYGFNRISPHSFYSLLNQYLCVS